LNEIDIINFQRDDSEFAFNFKHKIRELLADLKISKEDFMQKTGFDQTISDAYLYGNRMPTIKDLITITDALNVSLDYIFDKSQRKQISSDGESLLQAFDQCNEECQQYLIAKAQVLSVEGISAVAAGEYGKYIDEEKKSHPSDGIKKTGT
ncbi:MAG: helix-turn-helix transcriptional regulator, partial [Lachnospiraceae bacterium]|nr:helix-turn-helix transcriptional regulator [Lachnospiraceae bacterium]